jgi:hypothetical protein
MPAGLSGFGNPGVAPGHPGEGVEGAPGGRPAHRQRLDVKPQHASCGPLPWKANCFADRPHSTGTVRGRTARSPAPCLHGPPVGLHLVRPLAGASARLAEQQLRHVPCCRPRPIPHMMPGARGVLVAMASFPAPIGAGHFGAAGLAYLLAGRYGKRDICHLRDPLRCRLAVRVAGLVCWPSWRRSRQRDTVAATAYSRHRIENFAAACPDQVKLSAGPLPVHIVQERASSRNARGRQE